MPPFNRLLYLWIAAASRAAPGRTRDSQAAPANASFRDPGDWTRLLIKRSRPVTLYRWSARHSHQSYSIAGPSDERHDAGHSSARIWLTRLAANVLGERSEKSVAAI